MRFTAEEADNSHARMHIWAVAAGAISHPARADVLQTQNQQNPGVLKEISQLAGVFKPLTSVFQTPPNGGSESPTGA